jgi:hypothetical protein
MHPIRALAALAIAASAVTAVPAAAHEAAQSSTARPVLVCGTDAATRRAFTREHGAAPVFITAREALALTPADPAWSTPRCMTAIEHARYVNAATTYARAR